MTKTVDTQNDERLDWMIARLLLDSPQISQADMAADVKLHVSSVQRKIASMVTNKILSKAPTVWSWRRLGFPLQFSIAVQIHQAGLLETGAEGAFDKGIDTQEKMATFIQTKLVNQVAERLKNLEPGSDVKNLEEHLYVEDVVIFLGNPAADLTVMVRARSHHAVLKFVTLGLRAMRSIASTATHQAAWSCRDERLKR